MKRVCRHELQSEYSDLEPSLLKYIEEFPEYDLHEMLKEVLLGESILWMGKQSFAIGAPVIYHNNDKTFLMECTAGNLEEILDGMEGIEEDIAAWGYTAIEVCGRMGWKLAMKPYGFKVDRVILKKTIGEDNGR